MTSAAERHVLAYGASCKCRRCQNTTEQRVAGVLASLKLGWEIRPDEKLGQLERVSRIAQRETVKLIEEALSGGK